MVDIPKGDFIMGYNNANSGKKPEHRVELDEFKISKFIVTNELYEKFDPEHYEKRDKYSDKDNQPVLYVNWYDAYMFCRWCNCDLPTEAQWEYACRAGTKTEFNVGNNLTKNDANYGRNIGKTTEVGQYKKNKFGLYDMHGNTFEWCQDWYDSEFYKKFQNEKKVKNPMNSEKGSNRVIRGGSWYDSAVICRSAYRYYYWFRPGDRFFNVSFRPVSRKFIGR
jgi:formylglycine-generating enzyme required for sulfatase activity